MGEEEQILLATKTQITSPTKHGGLATRVQNVFLSSAPILAVATLLLGGCSSDWRWPSADPKFTGPGCHWPECAMSCEPCALRRVGKCVPKLLGMDLRYMCETNTTHCMVGRCVCKKGFCAGDFTLEGLNHGDPARLRECVKQVCYEGGRPPKFEPTLLVQFFASLAPSTAFRQAYELKEKYKQFALTSSFVAVMLCFIGLCVALLTLVCLCAGHGACRGACGCKISWWCCGSRHTWCDCVDFPQEDFGLDLDGLTNADVVKMRTMKPPPVWPMLRATLAIAFMCSAAVTVREFRGDRFNHFLRHELLQMYKDSRNLASEAAVVNKTVGYVTDALVGIQKQCLLTDPVLVHSTKNTAELLKDTTERIMSVLSVLEDVPPTILELRDFVRQAKPYLVWVPVLPQICVGVISIVCAIPAVLLMCCKRCKCLPHLMDIFLLWLSWVFVSAIVLVTVIATVELAAGTAASVVCLDVDRYALHYSRLAPNDVGRDAMRHYIVGDVPNPVQEVIDEASMMGNQVLDLYEEFRLLVDIIGWSCMPLYNLDVPKVVRSAKVLLTSTRRIVSAEHVWPYYRNLVQDGFCTQVLDSVAWEVIFQVVVCLILFPMSTIRVHHFLLRRDDWLQERKQIKRAKRAAKLAIAARLAEEKHAQRLARRSTRRLISIRNIPWRQGQESSSDEEDESESSNDDESYLEIGDMARNQIGNSRKNVDNSSDDENTFDNEPSPPRCCCRVFLSRVSGCVWSGCQTFCNYVHKGCSSCMPATMPGIGLASRNAADGGRCVFSGLASLAGYGARVLRCDCRKCVLTSGFWLCCRKAFLQSFSGCHPSADVDSDDDGFQVMHNLRGCESARIRTEGNEVGSPKWESEPNVFWRYFADRTLSVAFCGASGGRVGVVGPDDKNSKPDESPSAYPTQCGNRQRSSEANSLGA